MKITNKPKKSKTKGKRAPKRSQASLLVEAMLASFAAAQVSRL